LKALAAVMLLRCGPLLSSTKRLGYLLCTNTFRNDDPEPVRGEAAMQKSCFQVESHLFLDLMPFAVKISRTLTPLLHRRFHTIFPPMSFIMPSHHVVRPLQSSEHSRWRSIVPNPSIRDLKHSAWLSVVSGSWHGHAQRMLCKEYNR